MDLLLLIAIAGGVVVTVRESWRALRDPLAYMRREAISRRLYRWRKSGYRSFRLTRNHGPLVLRPEPDDEPEEGGTARCRKMLLQRYTILIGVVLFTVIECSTSIREIRAGKFIEGVKGGGTIGVVRADKEPTKFYTWMLTPMLISSSFTLMLIMQIVTIHRAAALQAAQPRD